jgi:hypothetical protein
LEREHGVLRPRPARLAALVLAASLIGWIWVAPAWGAQRYADAGSSLTSGTCPQGAPCRIDYAINSAGSGDEVIVGPGSYDVTSLPALNPAVPLTIHGAAGGPLPLLTSASSSFIQSTLFVAAGSTVSDLSLVRTVAGPAALFAGADTTVERVVASSDANYAAIAMPRGTIRDSAAFCSGSSCTAVFIDAASAGDRGASTIHNVTAIASDSTSYGIGVRNFVAGAGVQSATVRNSIARGGTYDMNTDSEDGPATAALDIDYSNYDPTKLGSFGPGNNSFTTGPHSQDAAVLPAAFVNLGAKDVHEAPGSPTIDAGLDGGANGPFDYEGDPRTLGAHADIGADEFVPEFVPASASPSAPKASPSNAISFGRLQRNRRRGTARLTVIVPGPGTLTLAGSGLVSQAARDARAAGSTTTSVTGGPVVLLLRAKGRARRKLERSGKVGLSVTVTFAPLGGTPAQATRSIKLRKNLGR